MDPFLSWPMGCESLSVGYHGGCIACSKNTVFLSVCMSVGAFVCLTAHGVAVRNQVLLLVWGQAFVGMAAVYGVRPAWLEINSSSINNAALSKQYQMADIAGPSPLLWWINAIYYITIFIPAFLYSSRETVCSAQMSFGHHFMSAADHSTADAMKPSISTGLHAGAVNPSLVNLYLTPLFPRSPQCHPLSSSVSMAVSVNHRSSSSHASYLEKNKCQQNAHMK